ncbi:MAG TPA: PD-(D/E)XK nuclease family protein [Lutibacter sp.]|nr:PD-(D/E)XK nuclease family protein [Lutibacter sp.]
MESFLLKVVKTVRSENTNLGKLVFVLPNQRAGVHIKKHLKNQINSTTLFPEIITFDSLAQQISDIPKISRVQLLFEFYEIYKQETSKKETEAFDVFANWASTVLNDFNEIDAYLVNPKSIFTNLKDINQLQNWNPNTDLTQNYLSFLKDLEKYYIALYQKLVVSKKGYQGLILKEAVESLTSFIQNTKKHFVFVGFNQLKTSESQIIQELLEAEKASIFWDISDRLLSSNHPAGKFIRLYLSSWKYYKKNQINWITKSTINTSNIEIIGIPKNVGMIKFAGELLDQSIDIDTALILAEQNLLPITLNSLPRKIEKVNITMGLPLKNFPFSDLVKAVFELHIQSNSQQEGKYYYKNVLKVLQHPIVLTHFKEVDSLVKKLLTKNLVYYTFDSLKEVNENSISANIGLLNLFKKTNSINKLLKQLNSFINILKEKIDGYEKEVLYKHFQLNQQILKLNNTYDFFQHQSESKDAIKTCYKIYKNLLFTENLNFIGEPLQGLQIMGFLETQALAFNHIIITSLNEGILPKSSSKHSFIPFDIRKHYGLPTYNEENANLSYHFFRLLDSANKISLLYNNQTDTFGGGEKSQFLTQLIWEYPTISQKTINPLVSSDLATKLSVDKTEAILEKLQKIASKGFSPSALGSYLYNPISFYQQRILGVNENAIIEEIIADNTMGTVIHNVLEILYKPFVGKILTVKKISDLFPKVRKEVEVCFSKEYPSGQIVEGKNKLIFEVIVQFIFRFLKNEIRNIKEGRIIRVLALEKHLEAEIDFLNFDFPIKIKGIVDRIDEVDGVVRIIDYKSGRVLSSQLNINDFNKLSSDYKYSKALQILLYAYLYTQDPHFDSSKELQAGIISFKNLQTGFMPVNFGTTWKKDYIITTARLDEFLEVLERLLLEIFDLSIPFEEKD